MSDVPIIIVASKNLLVFAIGRSLDYNDVDAIDKIVDAMERRAGQLSAVIGESSIRPRFNCGGIHKPRSNRERS